MSTYKHSGGSSLYSRALEIRFTTEEIVTDRCYITEFGLDSHLQNYVFVHWLFVSVSRQSSCYAKEFCSWILVHSVAASSAPKFSTPTSRGRAQLGRPLIHTRLNEVYTTSSVDHFNNQF